jgi:hypothetical protein
VQLEQQISQDVEDKEKKKNTGRGEIHDWHACWVGLRRAFFCFGQKKVTKSGTNFHSLFKAGRYANSKLRKSYGRAECLQFEVVPKPPCKLTQRRRAAALCFCTFAHGSGLIFFSSFSTIRCRRAKTGFSSFRAENWL